MAEFLTTHGTSNQIEKIITGANKKLILVSPYLQISRTFYERLFDASNRNVLIKIIYGKDELKPTEKESLVKLNNLELFYFENLHAKCYFNEKEMVITSMNMYEYSEKNNREMGVFVSRVNDKKLFNEAVNETLSIIQSSKKKKLRKHANGFCIRCKDKIEFNFDKPYCWECYAIWYQFENPEYEEKFCHSCGEIEISTMLSPSCLGCD